MFIGGNLRKKLIIASLFAVIIMFSILPVYKVSNNINCFADIDFD